MPNAELEAYTEVIARLLGPPPLGLNVHFVDSFMCPRCKADTTADKIERMKAAGISVAERIEDIPALVKERLKGH